MAIIIGGHETGLLDTSFNLLNRNDQTRNGSPGHGEQIYVNASNGNLLIQQRDTFLPSQGDDFTLVRTYNARGRASDAQQHEDARWTFSSFVRLNVRNGNDGKYFEVEYGDGSMFDYRLDAATGLFVSTDGAGAFETIQDLNTNGNTEPSYVLTRADQSQLSFDSQGHMLSWVDTNGVRMDYVYESDRLVQVLDDQGHVLNYVYLSGHLFQITDEAEGVLVEYHYTSGRLTEVIDRFGHSTQYFYTNDGFLERIVLPKAQMVNGVLETHASREIKFQYDEVSWRGPNKATAKIVTQITNAEGGITSFEYDFILTTPGSGNGKGKGQFKNADTTTTTSDDKFFQGGSTRVVDAFGNQRAFSNDAESMQWRQDNGYYATFDANLAATDPNFQAQVDAIRHAHSLSYTYRSDSYITEVVDQQGFHTTYAYDTENNLIAVTDRNGWGAVNSDSNYFRQLRAELGYLDAASNGKLVAELSDAEKTALLEAFTSHFTYDSRGNLLTSTNNADNLTSFTYTAFNKVATSTSAVGNALVSSNDQQYQDQRVALGYAALVENLSAADIQALLDLHTTVFSYDDNQNLIQRTDPGGDITRFEYDVFGNQTKRIVFLDPNDFIDPTKQQVTQFIYDAFGNNIKTIDGEGNQSFSDYDHFGNLLRFTDGNGGITTFIYDNDNRLLTVTDAEGHTTVNTYDAVGNRISVTDADGHTITRIFDRNNNLISTLDPSATDPLADRTTLFQYDVIGSRTATIDAQGRQTTFNFNERRELVEVLTAQVADANGNPTIYSSTFGYDGEGNRIRTNNNRGFVTEILYTQNNLIRQQTDPNGHITRFVYDANNNQLQIIAGMQLPEIKRQILKFSYDEEDQLVTQTDAQGNTTRFAYDTPGNRLAVTDANGNSTDFQYDHNNRLILETRPQVTDPNTGLPVRNTVQHRYDANGNEVETIDENGNSTKFSFDKDERLVMVEDANNIKTVFQYDSRHNRTQVAIGVTAHVDVNGHIIIDNQDDAQVTRFTYDEFNQLIAQVDGVGNALADSDNSVNQTLRQELGFAALVANLSATDQQALRNLHTRHFSYDRVGNQITSSDNLGRTNTFTYDALNRLLSRDDPLNQSTSFSYDGNGNRVAQVDALGRQTAFAYDSVDRLTDSTDPLGVITHRDYDDFGNLTTETRAFGTLDARTTTFDYDLNNRVIKQTDPKQHSQSFEYDAVGNRLKVTDALGNASQFIYDARNRNIKIIDPLSFETRFEYDGVGNRISLIDARGGITRFDYDPGNRRIQTTDAQGRLTRFDYDVRGNRITQRTAAGTADEEVTVFEYDAENNLRSVTDAEGNLITHDYDRVYNRTTTTDGNGHTTVMDFDAVNQVIRITDAQGGVTQFSYDAVSNRLTQTDALGRVSSFSYDANDRLLIQTATDGVETHFSYDAIGNRVNIIRAANTPDAATQIFTYNLDDQLIAQADALSNTTTFAYDANHNRSVVTDANGNASIYTYDANNRVVQIQDAEANVVQFAYDGNGNRTQVTDGRVNTSTTYYNANNEVALSVNAEGFATTFVYDNNGNVVSQTLHAQALTLPLDPNVVPTPASDPADQTTSFVYDKLNRVITRTDGEGFNTQFSYDAVGNRLQTQQQIDLAGTQFANIHQFYDNINRVIASVTAEGYLTQMDYDAVGNRSSETLYDLRISVPTDGSAPTPQTGDTGRTSNFSYDLANRLIRQTSPLGVHTDFEYDARGNRTVMLEASSTTDQRRTEFVYDQADRLTDTTNAAATVTHMILDANGNVTARHDAFGSVDVRVTGFIYDGNNRVTQQTDALGNITTNTYDANGNVTAITRATGLAEQRTESFEFNRNNRTTAFVNGAGERTEFVFDAAGNQVRITQAPGLAEQRINNFEYDRDNRQTAAVDALGVRSEFTYDGAGNKIQTLQAVGLPGQQRSSSYEYDLDTRLTQVTDPQGGVTQYQYDVLGNQDQIINANGGVQTNSFDVLGQLISSTSAGGILTQNSYDLRGNITSTIQSFADGSDARTTIYGYDLLDQQIRITDPEGFSTDISYDVFANQIQITHGQYLLNIGDPGYDSDKAARAFPQINSFAYDAVDRMISTTDGVGTLTQYAYDAVGNRTITTETANGTPRITTQTYDLADRVIKTINPGGGTVRNDYDAVGNKIAEHLLQSVDAGGVETWINRNFEYDANGKLTAEIDGLGNRDEHAYDALGNKTSIRFAAGTSDERIVRMEYDLNNRKTADVDGENNRTAYSHDALGNRTKVIDALGRVARFYYDGANNLITVLDPEGYLNTFNFDSAGNQTQVNVFLTRYIGVIDDVIPPIPTSSPQDRITSFNYDGANQVITRIDSDGTRTENRYDGAGNLIQEIQFANTTTPRTLTYNYDLNKRLINFTDVDGTLTTFAYDRANNTISESLFNASDPINTRTTTFSYNLNNQKTSQTFDPTGLNIVQGFSYDKLGNVITKTDGNGTLNAFAYDLDNRVITETIDPNGLNLVTVHTYDAVDNLISTTDARGNTTDFQYDNNNRQTQVINAAVNIFTISGGEQTNVRPTIQFQYDGAGNQVQTIDPNGFITTRYYDSNNRVLAEIDGHNTLREFTYNTAGDLVTEKVYMTQLTLADHNPNLRPAAPAGDSRTTLHEYDLAGRETRTLHPQIAVTTLSGTGGDSPTATTVLTQPEERKQYNAFGNEILTIDLNGNVGTSYYDAKDRVVATVDAAGFLIEWDYDSQDNVLEQRIYTQTLDPTTISPLVRPTPPAGEVHVVSRNYDAASRLLSERSPAIEIFDPMTTVPVLVRPTTRYTYDAIGNQLSITLAAGTPEQTTEHHYFDANNRERAVINGDRVLHLYDYDANGNLTSQIRFINPVPGTVDLTTLTGTTNFRALVTEDSTTDQGATFAYDALNRLSRETTLMGLGSGDDLTILHKYNSDGANTWRRDEDGFITQTAYNALGLSTTTISPDGSGTVSEYDAVGNQILGYTGVVDNLTLPATNVSATVADTVTISWDLPGTIGMSSRVVFDSQSHADLADYANQTAVIGSWFDSSAQAQLPTGAVGDTVYFRVVTQDTAGNTAWTGEHSLTIPPSLHRP